MATLQPKGIHPGSFDKPGNYTGCQRWGIDKSVATVSKASVASETQRQKRGEINPDLLDLDRKRNFSTAAQSRNLCKSFVGFKHNIVASYNLHSIYSKAIVHFKLIIFLIKFESENEGVYFKWRISLSSKQL